MLVVQIITGLLLSIFYKPSIWDAFNSIELFVRQVQLGWLIRYAHANGASFFFLVIYIHIGKAIYYGGYKKKKVWFSGLGLYLLLMAEAFTGYVLPWGQMSFWAAMVITNFFSIIPLIGKPLTNFIWGGFSVCETTLKRFFTIHFLLGLFLTVIVLIHLIVLHDKGSSSSKNDNVNWKVNFTPIFGDETWLALTILLFFFSYIIYFEPEKFMDPINSVPANPLDTPPHIVPEWYFLPLYTILRVTPSKTNGIILMGMAIIILFTLPFHSSKEPKKNITWTILFLTFVLNVIFLAYLGQCPAESLYITLGRYSATYYFLFLGVIMPFMSTK